MTVRVNKDSFNLREKLSELERPIGLKGSELMRSETAQEARDFISAGRKNLIINGAMQVAQRSTSATNIGLIVAYNTVDRWRFADSATSTARFTETQSSDAPEGFGFSRKFEVTTAATTINSTDTQYTDQFIEAQDLQVLKYGTSKAESFTISFYVKCSVAAEMGLRIQHEDGGGNYSQSYTINNANTWEYKTITVPGNTVTAINNDNGRGFRIAFPFTAGSSRAGTNSTQWGNGDLFGAHTNDFVTTNGATWQITGVQLEVGKNATEFEHRSYGEELALCQRYFQKIGKEGHAGLGKNDYIASGFVDASGSAFYGGANLKVTMRTSPTISINGTASHLGYTHPGVAFVATGINNYWSNPQSYVINLGGTGSGTTGFGAYARITDNATQLEFNAEL
jgi:hypothetical protein